MATISEIKTYLIEKISAREYTPNQRIHSLRWLAKETGASPLTIARAAHQLVDEGVLRVEKGRRGFLVADDPHGRRRQTISLMTTASGAGPYLAAFSRVTVACQRESVAEDITLQTFVTKRPEKNIVGSNTGYPLAEAVITETGGLLTIGIYDLLYLRKLGTLARVMVALDTDTSGIGLDCVMFDNMLSAAALVGHLHSLGAKRIAFVGGPFPPSKRGEHFWIGYDPCAGERYHGWRIGMHTAGLDPSVYCLSEYRAPEKISEAFKKVFAAGSPPDAILTEFPDNAVQCLEEMHIKPGDIPIAGWTNDDIPVNISPAIRFLAVCDFEEMGTVGIRTLLRHMREPELRQEHILISPKIWKAS